MLSWKKRRWIKIPGGISEAEFRESAMGRQAPSGFPYRLNRYFCKDDELFRFNGSTYALSNQWNHENVQEAAARIRDTFPQLKLSFEKKEKDSA